MFEVRFESTDGVRWRAGWWVASIGAGLMALGVAGAVLAPLFARNDSEGVIYFGIGVTAATIGFAAFILGRNLMFRRIVSRIDEGEPAGDEEA